MSRKPHPHPTLDELEPLRPKIEIRVIDADGELYVFLYHNKHQASLLGVFDHEVDADVFIQEYLDFYTAENDDE